MIDKELRSMRRFPKLELAPIAELELVSGHWWQGTSCFPTAAARERARVQYAALRTMRAACPVRWVEDATIEAYRRWHQALDATSPTRCDRLRAEAIDMLERANDELDAWLAYRHPYGEAARRSGRN